MSNSKTDQRKTDRFWMNKALELALNGRGSVSPNPLVGCIIIDKNGNKIAGAYHKAFGKAHAEVNAVKQVKDKTLFEQATVYVNLEPCAHHGKTPPCAPMLANLPIKRVVIAAGDPNPKVDGKGIALLRANGIDVEVGVLKKKALELNEFFYHSQEFGRPFITLKMAQTLDGFTAAADGHSKWISGPQSQKLVHEWRAHYDAVMIGRNTAQMDNPSLSVRHVSGRQPVRIVVDGPYSLPKNLNVLSDKFEHKTIVLTHNREKAKQDSDSMLKLMKTNYFRGEVLLLSKVEGHVDLRGALSELYRRNIHSILVEGGQQLGSAMLREGLVDKIEFFISPKMLGSGTRSILNIGINKMSEILDLKNPTWQKIGNDMLLTAYI